MNFAPRPHYSDDVLDELLRSALTQRIHNAQPSPRVLAHILSQIAAGPAQRPRGVAKSSGLLRGVWFPAFSAALVLCILVVGWMALPAGPMPLQTASEPEIAGYQNDRVLPGAVTDTMSARSAAQALLWSGENGLPVPAQRLRNEASPARAAGVRNASWVRAY